MSNKNYYRWGDQEIILVPVDSSVVVEVGDFICLAVTNDVNNDSDVDSVDYGIPPTYLYNNGSAANDRETAADQFLGIAVSASPDGKTDDLLVATAGVWELIQQAAAAISIGDAVEMYSDGTDVYDQRIVKGSTSQIAVCIEHKSSSSLTAVMCKLLPSKLLGTIQA